MLRRAVLLAPLAALSLAAPAGALDDVVLLVNGDGRVVVTGDEISAAEDVDRNQPGTVRRGQGQESKEDSGGTKVATVLELAKLAPAVVREVAVTRNGSPGTVLLSQGEIRAGFTGDPEGQRDATIYTGLGNGVRFFRPLRDADDVNVRDVFTTTAGSPLTVAVTTTSDERREVTASADDDTPDPGQPVRFSARLEGSTGGATFRWSWDFGDGADGSGQTPDAHRYRAGAYRATVTAVGDDGSVGVATVPVQVGTVAEQPSATPTATSDASGPSTGAGGGGPGSGGGAAAGGGTGDPDQAATGQRNRTPGRGDQRSDAGARGDAGRAPDTRPSPTASPAATAGATPPPAASPGTTAPSSGDTAPGASTGDERRRRRTPDRPGAAPDGEPIDGVLLAGGGNAQEIADLLAPPAPSEAGAARQSRRGGGGGNPLLGWAAGGGALLLLLVGGALREAGVRLPAAVRSWRRGPRIT